MVSKVQQLLSELGRELSMIERFEGRPFPFESRHTETLELRPARVDRGVQFYELRPQRVCRPFRLVVVTEDPWLVSDARAGDQYVLSSGQIMAARIFTPLPAWLLEPPGELPALEEARRLFPLGNIEPVAIQPGMTFSMRLEWGDVTPLPSHPPIVYVLADVLR